MVLSGFAVTGHIDSQKNSRIFVSEVLPEGLAFNEGRSCWVLTPKHTRNGGTSALCKCSLRHSCVCVHSGLRPGDEILVLNGRYVSSVELALIQTLFAEQTLQLRVRRDGPALASDCPAPPSEHSQGGCSKHHRAKSSSGAFIHMHLRI